jgi:hypothetical protein
VAVNGRTKLALAGTVLALGALAGACSSDMKMVRSWVDPQMNKESIKKIFVIGVANEDALRKWYEDTCVGLLKDLKYDAVPGYTLVSDPDHADKNQVKAQLLQQGFTHVLVTRVVHREDVEQYHPPTYMTVGYGGYPGYYGGWYPYWSMGYSTVASPGYVTSQTVLSVESNLYEIASEKMMFTGLTQAYRSEDPQSTVNQYLHSLFYEMRSKGAL